MFKKIIIRWIEFYQKILSPDHSEGGKARFPGGYCQYQPTCSQYAKEAIKKHGVLYGGIKGFWRILRCNPCSRGGRDEID